MPKLENFITHVKINSIPYAKNTINYQITSDETVSIYYLNDRDARVIRSTTARFNKWTDLNDILYTSLQDLLSDLDQFLYSIVLDPLDKAKGRVKGLSQRAIAGISETVSNVVFKDLWDHTEDLIYPTSGEQWSVVSSSDNDDLGGTGANTIVIFAMNDSFIEQSEIVNMDGQTPVLTDSTDWFRPGDTLVALSGSLQKNDGTITITAEGSGQVRSVIKPGNGRTFNGFITVPAGKTMFATQASAFAPKDEDVTIINRLMAFGSNTFISGGPVSVYQNSSILPFKSLPVLTEKTDIKLTAKSTNLNIRASLSVEFELLDGTGFPISSQESRTLML